MFVARAQTTCSKLQQGTLTSIQVVLIRVQIKPPVLWKQALQKKPDKPQGKALLAGILLLCSLTSPAKLAGVHLLLPVK